MDIPIELFGIFVGISAFMAILGLIRQPQIPAMITFGGMFLLVISMSTTNIVFGQLLDETTSHQNSVNWFFRSDNWVGSFNGASSYAQASANTVYDITTQDFWTVGLFKRTSDSGILEIIQGKKGGTGASAGYLLIISSSDQLISQINDSSGGVQITVTVPTTIAVNVWYAYGLSADRDGNMQIYLYNLDTGELNTVSTSIATKALTLTNTQTYTVGRSPSSGSAFYTGNMDYIIPPQTGLLTENQFDAWITEGDFGALPTFNNLYEFELNLNDSVGANNLVNNGVGFQFEETELVVSDINTYTPNNYEFTELPKAVMGLISVVLMLTGAMMVFKNE